MLIVLIFFSIIQFFSLIYYFSIFSGLAPITWDQNPESATLAPPRVPSKEERKVLPKDDPVQVGLFLFLIELSVLKSDHY